MKKILLATTALVVLSMGCASAADLRLPAYQVPLTRVYSWTGLYMGGNVGYSSGYAKNDETLLGVGDRSESHRIDGVIGGIQTGYNHQFGAWVLGFETDIQASGQKGGSTVAGIGTTVTTDHKLDWFGTSQSRLGFLFTPNILVYGTAGVAYGEVEDSATISALARTATFKEVKAGWTAGGGIEGVLGGAWSAKLEYLYIDLGKTEQTFAAGTVAAETRQTTDNIVRVGLNYKWGSGY
jgi:outer membrane immunogenic protein